MTDPGVPAKAPHVHDFDDMGYCRSLECSAEEPGRSPAVVEIGATARAEEELAAKAAAWDRLEALVRGKTGILLEFADLGDGLPFQVLEQDVDGFELDMADGPTLLAAVNAAAEKEKAS
jgi:hypothetical protein